VAYIEYIHLYVYISTYNKTSLYVYISTYNKTRLYFTIRATGIKFIPNFIKRLIFIITLYSMYSVHAICTDSPTLYSVVYFTKLYLRTYNVDRKGQVIVVFSI
jgi:hypothetical protein